MSTLCIWLPDWPLQYILADRPELYGRPIIIYSAARAGSRDTRVVSCCHQSRAAGIEPGVPLAEVETAWGRSGQPAPQLVARDREAEQHQLEVLAEDCLQFSPHVSLESAADITRPGGCQSFPQALLLHTRHLAPSRGGSHRLLRTIQENFSARGYQVRLAHAATPGAAWALAHYSDLSTSLPACIPARFIRLGLPSGAWWAPHPETRAALDPLPVEALRIPPQATGLLHQLGITRIGQLRQLPRPELSLRFGPELCRQLDYALGQQRELLVHYRPPDIHLHRQLLESPLADRRDLQQVLEHLLQRLLASLAGSNRGIVQLYCRFLGEGGQREFPLTLYLPSVDFEHLASLLQGHLERGDFPGQVSQVEMEATMTASLGQYQQHLFPPAAGDLSSGHRPLPAQLGRLLERLCCRLETGSVLHPRLLPEAQPEHCWEHSPPRTSGRGSRHLLAPGTIRPLLLLPHPRQLSPAGSFPDGFPCHFDDGRRRYRVAHHWGPERIETGWWRKATVRRDYYRVELASGHRFWVYQDLFQGRWFLHGMFA
jgi:protein ImuB